MTVSSDTLQITHNCDGASTVFAVPFYFLQDQDLTVTLKKSDGTDSLLVLGTHYTVSGAGNEDGGSVTTLSTYASGNSLFIERVVDITQETAYQDNDPFPAKAHETALDKLTMICQQMGRLLGFIGGSAARVLMLGDTDTDGAGSYRAGGNRIQDLGDPINAQDATTKSWVSTLVTNTYNALITYCDRAVAGVVGGFGWFLQWGTGATYRTFQDKMRDVVSVRDFGAVGDGVTDDSAAIRAACAAIQARGGGTLLFPKGIYFVNQHRIADGTPGAILNFTFTGLAGLAIEGDGSKLVMQGGWTRNYAYEGCLGFEFNGCSQLSVRNLEMDGGAATITKVYASEGISYGLNILGCTDINIDNVNIHHYCTDGISLNASGTVSNLVQSKRALITNSLFNNNARLGASVIQCRHAAFINCSFNSSGYAGTYGNHSPSSGVDIEPDYTVGAAGITLDDNTGDISFSGCLFQDNLGFAFVSSSVPATPYPIQLDKCVFRNTRGVASRVTPGTAFTTIRDCLFENVSFEPSYGINNVASNVLVSRCVFNHALPGLYCIQETGIAARTIAIEDCHINLLGATPNTVTYRVWLTGPNNRFVRNKLFVSAGESNGANGQSIAQVNGRYVKDNVFDTDLSVANTEFSFTPSGAVVMGNYYANPAFLGERVGTAANIPGGSIPLKVINFVNYSTTNAPTLDIGTTAPTTGTYVAGSRRFNSAPAVGSPKSWVCTVSGTPGTWVSEGNL